MEQNLHLENPDRADLMAGIIEHMACYIQTGRPRSAHLAALLLHRLARDAEADDTARERCRELGESLDDHARQNARAPMAFSAARRPGPWLTWENLSEAA